MTDESKVVAGGIPQAHISMLRSSMHTVYAYVLKDQSIMASANETS